VSRGGNRLGHRRRGVAKKERQSKDDARLGCPCQERANVTPRSRRSAPASGPSLPPLPAWACWPSIVGVGGAGPGREKRVVEESPNPYAKTAETRN
jgi:hypothetical protein